MTDTAQTPVDTPSVHTYGLTPSPEGTGADEGIETLTEAPGNREARYRVERNEARAERDALSTVVERLQRKAIEQVAALDLSMPSDLFDLSGNGVQDYLGGDGEVDTEKVKADVAAILQERPGLSKKAPAYDPSQGTGGSGIGKTAPDWSALFQM